MLYYSCVGHHTIPTYKNMAGSRSSPHHHPSITTSHHRTRYPSVHRRQRIMTRTTDPLSRRRPRCCSTPSFSTVRVAAVAMNAMTLCSRPIGGFALLARHRHRPRPLLPSAHRRETIIQRRSHCTPSVSPRVTYRPLHATSDFYSLDLRIPTPEDMEDVGGLLSVGSTKGDVILLDGDLGAGKTCFSRGFVRGRTGSENERVTSPTYLLSNAYAVDGGDVKVYHMDLYRLSGAEEDLAPLDLENVFANHIALVEWPERLSEKPTTRLDITLTIDSTIQNEYEDEGEDEADNDDDEPKCRCLKLVPHGERWVERLKFLESEGYLEDLVVDSSL